MAHILVFKNESCAPAMSCRLFNILIIYAVPLPRRVAYFMFFKINISSVPSRVAYFIFLE